MAKHTLSHSNTVKARPFARLGLILAIAGLPLGSVAYGDAPYSVNLFAEGFDQVEGDGVVTSADGRFVAYRSSNHQLVEGIIDENFGEDVFLLDRNEGSVTLVSRSHNDPNQAADTATEGALSITDDGRYVVFSSTATDLTPDTNANLIGPDVFLFDRLAGTVVLISRSAVQPNQTGDSDSFSPQISRDGSAILFRSDAMDLLPTPPGSGGQAWYHYDLVTEQLQLVNHRYDDPAQASGFCGWDTFLSADGDHVVISCFNGELVAGATGAQDQIYLFHADDGSIELVTQQAGSPGVPAGLGVHWTHGLGGDGSVLFASTSMDLVTGQVDTEESQDLFLYRPGQPTKLITHRHDDLMTAAASSINDASLSDDGQSIAFSATSQLLLPSFPETASSNQSYRYQLATNTAELLSHVPGDPSTGGNRRSDHSEISRNGNRIVFQSQADNLVATDDNGRDDVFVFGLGDSAPTLVSHRASDPDTTADSPSRMMGINALFRDGFALSGDGGHAFFNSSATDLADQGRMAGNSLFEFSFVDGTVGPVAQMNSFGRNWSAGDSDLAGAQNARGLSDDGRFLALFSRPSAGAMVPGQTHTGDQVFLYDSMTGGMQLASRSADDPTTGSELGIGAFACDTDFELSGDGRFLAFVCFGGNLTSGTDANDREDVFLFDRDSGLVTLVSHSLGGLTDAGNNRSIQPTISADGDTVFYFSQATDLTADGQDGLFFYDRLTGINTLLPLGELTDERSISDDGGRMVIDTRQSHHPQDSNNLDDVYLWNRATHTISWISQALGGVPGNGNSGLPKISADGHHVVFASASSNFEFTDNNSSVDVFWVDLETAERKLISHVAGDPQTAADDHSFDPLISDDGNKVAFVSQATNLVNGQATGDRRNVYVYDVPSGQTTLITSSVFGPLDVGADSSIESLSADGSVVLVRSEADDLLTDFPPNSSNSQSDLFKYALGQGEPELINHKLDSEHTPLGFAGAAGLSDDGTTVAFRGRNEKTGGLTDVLLSRSALELDVDIAMSAPSTVEAGDPLTFDITPSKVESNVAPPLQVSLLRPETSPLTGVSGGDWACREVGAFVRCDHPPIAVGASIPDLSITLEAPAAGGRLDYEVTIVSPAVDPDSADNQAEQTVVVTGGDWIFSDGFESGDLSVWSE